MWARVGLVVALLAASAAARQWQAHRVDQAIRDGRVAPFPLKDIPETLGDWEGVTSKIDPHIARATGSTDSVFRTYQHRRTGQRIDLILLFGPSTEMYIHTPENCYPASGFTQVAGPNLHNLPVGKAQIPFHSLIYAKGEGSTVEREEVYYTWHYSGRWTPDLVTAKGFERIPGMFKVHIQRRVMKAAELELLDVGNPSEAFLAALMPEIQSRMARTQPKAETKAETSTPPSR
jgi:EpsI family protein